jgi:hypothetical protein
MNQVARFLDHAFKGFGFTLMVFDLNAISGGRMNYVSNANRADMVTAMKEFIANSEGRAHEAPAARQ